MTANYKDQRTQPKEALMVTVWLLTSTSQVSILLKAHLLLVNDTV